MTLANMRQNGARSLRAFCAGRFCNHSKTINVDSYADDLAVPDFGPKFVCSRCGAIGAEVMPDWPAQMRGLGKNAD
jgi:hypothetical protein